MAIPVETFFLAPEAEGTLQAQIQQMIAQGILSGRFRKGEKLPWKAFFVSCPNWCCSTRADLIALRGVEGLNE